MKVLQLMSSGGMYGAEVVLLNLARGLAASGTEVIVGVFHNRNNPHLELAERLKDQGVRVEVISCAGRMDISAVLQIRRIIEKSEIEIVHSHGYKSDIYGFLATCFSSTRIVGTSHNWTGKDEVPPIYNSLDRMVLRRFDRVVVVSNEVEEKLKETGVRPERIARIANGIDLVPFESTVSGSTLRTAADEAVVGMVARLVKEKGCYYFLRAAAEVLKELPATRFLLVGDGPERASLQKLAAELGIQEKVSFLGHCSEMPQLYATLDICVLPSFLEAMPMTIIEAMAAGKPMIATSVGEIPAMITNEFEGLLVQPRNVEELSKAMSRLIRDTNLRTTMGKNGQEKARKMFSAEAMVGAYVSLYEGVVGAKEQSAVSAVRRA